MKTSTILLNHEILCSQPFVLVSADAVIRGNNRCSMDHTIAQLVYLKNKIGIQSVHGIGGIFKKINRSYVIKWSMAIRTYEYCFAYQTKDNVCGFNFVTLYFNVFIKVFITVFITVFTTVLSQCLPNHI